VARALTTAPGVALDGVDAQEVPPDLAAALANMPGARSIWDDFPRSVRRGALEIVLNARLPQTRAARIGTILDCVMRGKRPFQWRKDG